MGPVPKHWTYTSMPDSRPPSQRYARATQIGETEAWSSHLPHHDSAKGLPCQNSNPEPIAFLGLTTTRRSCNWTIQYPPATITNPGSQGTRTLPKKDANRSGDTQQEPDNHSRPDPYLTSWMVTATLASPSSCSSST